MCWGKQDVNKVHKQRSRAFLILRSDMQFALQICPYIKKIAHRILSGIFNESPLAN